MITEEPIATPVTTPVLALTVAIDGEADSQVTVCDAPEGRTVAVSGVVAPTLTVGLVGATVTLDGATGVSSTYTDWITSEPVSVTDAVMLKVIASSLGAERDISVRIMYAVNVRSG